MRPKIDDVLTWHSFDKLTTEKMRHCKRCGEIFRTYAKFGKYCTKCKKN